MRAQEKVQDLKNQLVKDMKVGPRVHQGQADLLRVDHQGLLKEDQMHQEHQREPSLQVSRQVSNPTPAVEQDAIVKLVLIINAQRDLLDLQVYQESQALKDNQEYLVCLAKILRM
jgi:hypothetical protein